MTLRHDPGSLSVMTRLSGTVPSYRLGSMGAAKSYAGTIRRPFAGGGYGSFGTLAAGHARPIFGTILGTVSAHRFSGNYPGTWRTRPVGSATGTKYFAAPPRARFISVSGLQIATATQPVISLIRQSLQGTVAATQANQDAAATTQYLQLRGWLLANHGSYYVIVGGNGATYWKEWDP